MLEMKAVKRYLDGYLEFKLYCATEGPDIITEAMKRINVNRGKYAKLCGVSAASMTNYFKGRLQPGWAIMQISMMICFEPKMSRRRLKEICEEVLNAKRRFKQEMVEAKLSRAQKTNRRRSAEVQGAGEDVLCGSEVDEGEVCAEGEGE